MCCDETSFRHGAGMHRSGHAHGGCCCHPGLGERRFWTKEEIIKELEGYLEQLRAEARGVEEEIARLKSQT